MIEIKKLFYKYPGAKKYALENINLTIESGKYIAILGVTFASSMISYWASSMIKFQNKYGIVVNLIIFAIIYLIIWFILIFIFRKDLIKKVLRRKRK